MTLMERYNSILTGNVEDFPAELKSITDWDISDADKGIWTMKLLVPGIEPENVKVFEEENSNYEPAITQWVVEASNKDRTYNFRISRPKHSKSVTATLKNGVLKLIATVMSKSEIKTARDAKIKKTPIEVSV